METRLQKDKLKYIVLREQASHAGISIAEASTQTEVMKTRLVPVDITPYLQ